MTTSLWVAGAEAVEPGRALQGAVDLDVAIVGGGFTGVATAYFLTQLAPSLRVGLLEAHALGHGASGRNAGFVMTQFGADLGYTEALYGRERTVAAHRYLTEAVALVGDLVREHDLDCDYERGGFLRVATTAGQLRRLAAAVARAERLGLAGIRWMDGAELAREVASPRHLGAWWEPGGALVSPLKLLRGLAAVAVRAGVVVYEHTLVGEVARTAAGVRLTTPGGEVRAARVVIATNAYSDWLPALRGRQQPFFSHVIATAPLTEAQLAPIGWHHRQGIEDAQNLVHYYRLTADRRLVLGGTEVTVGADGDRDRARRTFARLEHDLGVIFPSLRGVAIAGRWGGACSVTLDLAPAIGHLGDERVVYSLGCLGHGVALSHLNGRTLAELTLGRRTERTEVFFVDRRVIPWPPAPLRVATARVMLGLAGLEDRWQQRRVAAGPRPTILAVGDGQWPARSPRPEGAPAMRDPFTAGFEFREAMGGSYHLVATPAATRRFGFTATASVDHLLRFLRDGITRLTGVLEMPGFADRVPFTGTLAILPFVSRVLRYDLAFTGNDGARYRFAGEKRLRPLHLAASLARLPAVVSDAAGRAVAEVDATFDVRHDLGPLLRTLRPVLGPAAAPPSLGVVPPLPDEPPPPWRRPRRRNGHAAPPA